MHNIFLLIRIFWNIDVYIFLKVRFNPHDYGTIQEIADEITNIQGIKHDSLVKYFGVELHKVRENVS